LYFQLHYLPEETCFQQAGPSAAVEGTSQAGLGSSDQLKVLASLSLFLKSEKKSQLCFTYEKGLSSTGPSVIFNLFPRRVLRPLGDTIRKHLKNILEY
jgi:hypothetical protein